MMLALNWTLPFHVFVDAFDIAIQATLMQDKISKWFWPIYYESKMMTMAERNYLITKREALGVIHATHKSKHYLLGN